MKPTKIVFLPEKEFSVGGYSMRNDTIYLDANLYRYPKLLTLITKHELYHAEHKNNIWKHIYNDLKDIFIWFRYDWFEYYYLGDKLTTIEKQYYVFNIFRSLISIPIMLLAFLFNIIRYFVYMLISE